MNTNVHTALSVGIGLGLTLMKTNPILTVAILGAGIFVGGKQSDSFGRAVAYGAVTNLSINGLQYGLSRLP